MSLVDQAKKAAAYAAVDNHVKVSYVRVKSGTLEGQTTEHFQLNSHLAITLGLLADRLGI